MDSVLIISPTEKSAEQIRAMLPGIERAASVTTAGEARRLLTASEFDMFVINAPLADERGDGLAKRLAERLSGEVILIVKDEIFMETSEKLAEYGILTVSKPLNRTTFWGAVKLAEASRARFAIIRRENLKLQQKIEDIRVIDRAKCLLIANMKMTEPEAHKYIERQAMDMRVSRRGIAETILRTYEM
ncbi:MAG: ANTAR domain-containing protein [Oscillospiraceae bacterium]|jgi:response regulator NasT|nr:ANTAR domain-containing protein [Oscillospiraceae bacterium]